MRLQLFLGHWTLTHVRGEKNRHQSHRCQVTHKKEVNHWLLLLFTVWLWSPSFPQPLLTPSGLQLAHFISAEKSTAPRCSDKRSVLILVPQYALGDSQMSPNYVASPGRRDAEPATEPPLWKHQGRKRTLRGTQTEMAGREDSCPPIPHSCLTGNINSLSPLPASQQTGAQTELRKEGVLFLCNWILVIGRKHQIFLFFSHKRKRLIWGFKRMGVSPH